MWIYFEPASELHDVWDIINPNANAKMSNVACHLAGAYVVVLMPTLVPLLWQLMLAMMQS